MSYLYLVNDPIPGQGGLPGKDIVNLTMALSLDQIEDYKKRFRTMPRQVFDATMAESLAGYVPKGEYGLTSMDMRQIIASDEQKMIYALMLDLFNEVNQAELISRGISDPWEWEAQKMMVLYQTQAEANLAATHPQLFLQSGSGDDYTKIIVREGLEKRAVKISNQIPDQAYNIQFTVGIKALLDQEEWEMVELIIQSYESLPVNTWETLKQFFNKQEVQDAT